MVEELDLVALRRPCYITLEATGRRVALRFFKHEQKQIYRRWKADPNNAALLIELLRFAIPNVTDEELDDLSLDEDIARILGKADGKSVMVEAALKNGVSDGESQAPSPIQDSVPTTPTRTRSAGSRKRTSSGRGNSSTSTGTKSSSPSTG
jgi:hypothetical protein